MSTTHPTTPHDGDTLNPHLWFEGRGGSSAPHDGDTPDLANASSDPTELTAATATAEIAWVARQPRALRGSDDEQRRARFMARKAALLAYIEGTAGGEAS